MRGRQPKLNGLNPLAYLGVESTSPSLFLRQQIDPDERDTQFNIGTVCFNELTQKTSMLVNLDGDAAKWTALVASDSSYNVQFDGDAGSATPASGILNITSGWSLLSTVGVSNSVSLATTNGTSGQLLIGGGTEPVWGNITSTGGTVSISEGSNTLNLESVGSSGSIGLEADDANVAEPNVGAINVYGEVGDSIETAATGSTLTVDLSSDVTVDGTLTASAFGAGVLTSNGSGLLSSANGTNGQTLIGGTTTSWSTLSSTDSSIAITNGAGTISIDLATGGNGSPCFLAVQESSTTAILGGNVSYDLGENVVLTEAFDLGANFYPGDGAGTAAYFTAPETAKYNLDATVSIDVSGLAWSAYSYVAAFTLKIVTSNRTYYSSYSSQVMSSITNSRNIRLSVCADMDSGDVATYYVKAYVVRSDGTVQTTCASVKGASDAYTWVSGSIVL